MWSWFVPSTAPIIKLLFRCAAGGACCATSSGGGDPPSKLGALAVCADRLRSRRFKTIIYSSINCLHFSLLNCFSRSPSQCHHFLSIIFRQRFKVRPAPSKYAHVIDGPQGRNFESFVHDILATFWSSLAIIFAGFQVRVNCGIRLEWRNASKPERIRLNVGVQRRWRSS